MHSVTLLKRSPALTVNGLSHKVTLRSMIASLVREELSVHTQLRLLMLLTKHGMKAKLLPLKLPGLLQPYELR
jgi:hypothetical protein